ncbi:hypothetical protein EB796_015584 [Bugula neritina]|uniref:Uncharacterized protein n=1 Tax=Bugula neritina TaxID=10212 RepID=A0A7J7JJ78_BUGNE|nr:hypothetical protein EB796_015584 [Bugula neritina]
MRKQISDLIRKQHAHEGEIKWLRSTLKDKETQVNKVRVTLNAEAARQRLEHSEKERRFMKDIETLRSDLQFKENELVSVGQALEKLKKEKQKTLATAMKLGVDGFPTSTEGLILKPVLQNRLYYLNLMDTGLFRMEPSLQIVVVQMHQPLLNATLNLRNVIDCFHGN